MIKALTIIGRVCTVFCNKWDKVNSGIWVANVFFLHKLSYSVIEHFVTIHQKLIKGHRIFYTNY